MRIACFVFSLFLVVGLLAMPLPSTAQVAVGISVRIGPPVLPVYAQPICPGPGLIWVPGYWAYGPDGYFWVPGTWVEPPEVGLLWTPGYWGWSEGFYIWHAGYWGPRVGFYGGINYGFGYSGVGFFGGYWRGGAYYYNRSVTNVNVTVIHNTYNTTVINRNVNRVSFNGGEGGIRARPTREESEADRGRHFSMTSEQNHHLEGARGDRSLLASVNHGRPDFAATPRAGQFHGRGEAETRGSANPNRPFENHRQGDRPPSSRPSDASRANARVEQKQQWESDKLRRQQDAEHLKVQQRHVQEQQRLDRQRPSDQRQHEQLQHRQQQQVQQMEQKHTQQDNKLQQRQQHEAQKQQSRDQKGGRPPGR